MRVSIELVGSKSRLHANRKCCCKHRSNGFGMQRRQPGFGFDEQPGSNPCGRTDGPFAVETRSMCCNGPERHSRTGRRIMAHCHHIRRVSRLFCRDWSRGYRSLCLAGLTRTNGGFRLCSLAHLSGWDNVTLLIRMDYTRGRGQSHNFYTVAIIPHPLNPRCVGTLTPSSESQQGRLCLGRTEYGAERIGLAKAQAPVCWACAHTECRPTILDANAAGCINPGIHGRTRPQTPTPHAPRRSCHVRVCPDTHLTRRNNPRRCW